MYVNNHYMYKFFEVRINFLLLFCSVTWSSMHSWKIELKYKSSLCYWTIESLHITFLYNGYLGWNTTRPQLACIYQKVRQKYETASTRGYSLAEQRQAEARYIWHCILDMQLFIHKNPIEQNTETIHSETSWYWCHQGELQPLCQPDHYWERNVYQLGYVSTIVASTLRPSRTCSPCPGLRKVKTQ